jgi:hypothetical protein
MQWPHNLKIPRVSPVFRNPLRSIPKTSSRLWCGANVNGKKKVMKKQRRGEELD